jgi:protoheme IX farnesyltransferase
MVSTRDPDGSRTGLHALLSALLLLPVSLLPAWIGHSGLFYAASASLLSLAFITAAVRFARHPDHPRARVLFLASIIYLPLILTALAVDISVKSWLGW